MQKGHVEEFRELMRRHQNAAFRLAYRILGRREDAEDAVQETFLLVYRHLAEYKEKGRFWPWVRRIAVNVCLRKLPGEVPSAEVEDLQDSAHLGDLPVETEVLKRVKQSEIRRAISGLPPAYRTAVVLRYLEDMPYREIAELLGEPVTTIQVRLHRAKRMLSERLAVMLDEV